VLRTSSLLYSTVKIESSVSSYSKAPRGLFVQVRVGRIFTAISISPGSGSRQSLSRSTFRAGRNLPDKELRYHRTVIVTAAVHRSLDIKLSRQKRDHRISLTYRHWAGVSPYTLPFGFAETCVLVKQSLSVIHCGPAGAGQGISRKLRLAFVAEFLEPLSPACLGILNQRTCVSLRYGKNVLLNETFLELRTICVARTYRLDSPSLLG
jgi:hypothetical protein